MSIISIAEGARRLGITKQSLHQREGEPYFVEINGKRKIDDTHPEWLLRVQSPVKRMKNAKIKRGNDKYEKLKNIQRGVEIENTDEDYEVKKPHAHYQPPEITPEIDDLTRQAAIAEMHDTIYAAKIKEEKAKQEEIKTAELKKDLAPMYLIKYFFSFGENMIHRSFRINHEIIPELNALFLSGKLQEAEQLLNERQETIVLESQAELIKAMKEEGYNTDSL